MLNQFKRVWNESPLAIVGVGAAVVTSVAQLINALSATQGRRAYAKQVKHRIKKNR